MCCVCTPTAIYTIEYIIQYINVILSLSLSLDVVNVCRASNTCCLRNTHAHTNRHSYTHSAWKWRAREHYHAHTHTYTRSSSSTGEEKMFCCARLGCCSCSLVTATTNNNLNSTRRLVAHIRSYSARTHTLAFARSESHTAVMYRRARVLYISTYLYNIYYRCSTIFVVYGHQVAHRWTFSSMVCLCVRSIRPSVSVGLCVLSLRVYI